MLMLTGSRKKVTKDTDFDVLFLDGVEVYDKPLDPDDETQAKFFKLDSRLLKPSSMLYKELYRPDSYTPLLANKLTLFFNPNDEDALGRKSNYKPIIYLPNGLRSSAADTMPGLEGLKKMNNEEVWEALDLLLNRKRGLFDQVHTGLGSTQLEQAVLLGEWIGMKSAYLIPFEEALELAREVEATLLRCKEKDAAGR